MKPAQASSTAKVIAASTILLASDARSAALVAPGAAALCKQFLSGSRADRWLACSAAQPLTRWIWRALEKLTLPGIMAHYWHRKCWIEACCRRAIKEGCERVVVLGAGLDTLGWRLANALPHIDVIEIDHPATQEVKRLALTTGAAAPLANLRLMPVDLSAMPLPMALLDDGKATIVVIEGVLMYLSEEDIDRLFAALRQLCSERGRIVFSFMAKWADGRSGFRPRSWLVERWLGWRNEPFKWAVAPEAMEAFLAQRGFQMMEMALTREFSTLGNSRAAGALDGEHLVVCRRA
jgi:methyltransferase (TIGR00027 family)